MSSSDDEDPYDFVALYKKLKKERQNKVLLTNESSENNVEDDNKSGLNGSTLSNTAVGVNNTISSKVSNSPTTTYVTKKVCKRKRNNVTQTNPPLDSNILGPVICIGDFYDGYDMPSSVSSNELNNSISDIMNDCKTKSKQEDDASFALALLNREISVKVFWEGKRTHRFLFRMFQPMKSIYEHFAKLENIEETDISLRLRDKLLLPSDTPSSINYKITDFIDGSIEFFSDIINNLKAKEAEQLSNDEVYFKIKQQNVKHPMRIGMKKTDLMQVLYLKISEKLGLDLDSMTLSFDGDKIKDIDTIETLDLEGDECFELYTRN